MTFAKYSRTGVIAMALPLYGGPVLAGWSAAPWLIGFVLAAVFFLMQLLAGKKEGAPPKNAESVLLLALVQSALVAAVYAMGAIGAALTGVLVLPVWVPPGLTCFGALIWVMRYRHAPQEAAMADMLDKAIASIETGTPFAPGETDADRAAPETERAAQEALVALWALPTDGPVAPIGQIDQIVQRLEMRAGHGAFHALLGEVDEGNRNVDRAMLRYLASPPVRAALVHSDDLGFAMALLVTSPDAGVINELAALTATLLDENAPASALPPSDDLRRQARAHPDLTPLIAPVQRAHRAGQETCA